MSKILLLIVVASLVFLALKGESVRRYFGWSPDLEEATAVAPKANEAAPPKKAERRRLAQ
jgi:hypothetical protein